MSNKPIKMNKKKLGIGGVILGLATLATISGIVKRVCKIKEKEKK